MSLKDTEPTISLGPRPKEAPLLYAADQLRLDFPFPRFPPEPRQAAPASITLFIQAEFASKLGNVARARELYEQSEAKGVLALGEDHYLVNACRGVIADFLRDRAKDDEASVRLLRKVVAGFRKSFGPESPALASKLMLLARGERALKRTKAANEALAESRRINALYQPKK